MPRWGFSALMEQNRSCGDSTSVAAVFSREMPNSCRKIEGVTQQVPLDAIFPFPSLVAVPFFFATRSKCSTPRK